MTLAPNAFSYYYALPDICKEMVYKESFKVLKIEENIPDRVDIETDLIAIIHNINRFYNTWVGVEYKDRYKFKALNRQGRVEDEICLIDCIHQTGYQGPSEEITSPLRVMRKSARNIEEITNMELNHHLVLYATSLNSLGAIFGMQLFFEQRKSALNLHDRGEYLAATKLL
jgi:hypothetical protein